MLSDDPFVTSLAQALGLPMGRLRSFTLRCEAGQPVQVEACMYADAPPVGDDYAMELRRFTLQPIEPQPPAGGAQKQVRCTLSFDIRGNADAAALRGVAAQGCPGKDGCAEVRAYAGAPGGAAAQEAPAAAAPGSHASGAPDLMAAVRSLSGGA